jgi:hypothetical protein
MWRGDEDIGIIGDVLVFFSSDFAQGYEEGWEFFVKEEGGCAGHSVALGWHFARPDTGRWTLIIAIETQPFRYASLFRAPFSLSLFLFGTRYALPSSSAHRRVYPSCAKRSGRRGMEGEGGMRRRRVGGSRWRRG